MLKHWSVIAAALALGLPALATAADDGKPAQSAKTQSNAEEKKAPQKSDAPPASRAALKETLAKALKQVQGARRGGIQGGA